MQGKDLFDAGEDILKSVVNAIESQDYAGLSKNVEDKLNTAIEHINAKLNDVGKVHYGHNNMKSSEYKTDERPKPAQVNKSSQIPQAAQVNNSTKVPRPPQNQIVPATKRLPQLYAKKPPGTYSATALKVLGAVGTSITGVAAFVLTIVGFATGSMGVWLANAIVGGGLFGSIGMINRGTKLDARVSRFKQYVARIGQNQYCEIEQLAGVVGKKPSFVRKELRKMIDKGYFLQGHLDDNGTTLITSDAMYTKYLEAETSRRTRELETEKEELLLIEKKDTSVSEGEVSQYPASVQRILDEGKEYIQHIRECNDAIPGEAMSRKLSELEDIIVRIFEQLKKDPSNAADLQKMMKYYLPTTRKLIDAYRDLDGQPTYGENNIYTTKREIEDTLDVINEAFGKLFDDMFEDAAWDITTEISTMKTILAKEGLTGGGDFKYTGEETNTELDNFKL